METIDRILNDPVQIIARFYFLQSVFSSLTPLAPVYLETAKTTNMYYINQIRGYVDSKTPAEVELIKI